ncbi:MAG: P22 phage major capsid protein family protein [Bacteroidales bacterium]|jgi:hypothetical protein
MPTYNVLTTTENAVFIPTIISQKCIQRFPSYLNLAKTVSRDSDWTTATVGTTIRVPKTGAVVANDKTAGELFTKQNPTGTDVYVTLNKHKEVTITIDDVAKVVENQDTQNRYAEDGAIALAEAVEAELAALHPSIENTISFDATSATTIDTSMLNIRKFFTEQRVPQLEQKYLYVDSSVYNDLLATDKYSRYDARGNGSSITDGSVIRTYGIETHESQMVETSGSPVAYHNLAYTKNALVLASRPLPKPMSNGVASAVLNDPRIGLSLRSLFWYNGDLGAHQLTLDLLFGVAILDQRRIVEVEST